MSVFDVYCILDNALEKYLDSIALIEDPTDEQRKNYELVKFWKPSKPDFVLENILKSIVFATEQHGEEK